MRARTTELEADLTKSEERNAELKLALERAEDSAEESNRESVTRGAMIEALEVRVDSLERRLSAYRDRDAG